MPISPKCRPSPNFSILLGLSVHVQQSFSNHLEHVLGRPVAFLWAVQSLYLFGQDSNISVKSSGRNITVDNQL